MRIKLLAAIASIAFCSSVFASVVTFDETALAPGSHFGGPATGETGFVSGDAYFGHNDSGFSWDGFVYSNETDITTAAYTNQYSAYIAGGSDGTNQYGISYDSSSATWATIAPPVASFGASSGEDYNTTISGMWVTNTTYSYLSMFNGDAYAKKFGGVTGNDQDWFKLTIQGITENGYTNNVVDFYLADFRSDDNTQDYIIDSWTWVDLSSLGNVVGLEFTLTSSDVGDFGINTPTYFAMDNLNGSPLDAPPVPEPATIILMATGAIAAYRRR